MDDVEGSRSFQVGADAYDRFMGRYSQRLASSFADAAGIASGDRVLDVGCGPGALTGELVERLGSESVAACDPTPAFVAECAARHPGVVVRSARAESLPYRDGEFDAALAQLVLHFVSDPDMAISEMSRVVRTGGIVGACVWDFGGMEMIRRFWDAALAVDPNVPDEAGATRFGRSGELAELLTNGGCVDVVDSTLHVESTYDTFDDLWSGLLTGTGPAGAYCASLDGPLRDAVADSLHQVLGAPVGEFTLHAVAHCAVGSVPG